MNLLPQTYLLGLVGLLAIVAVVVGRQFFRVRRDEARLIELEKSDTASSRQASDLYELGSVQLRKRLYPQAAATLKQALKRRQPGFSERYHGFRTFGSLLEEAESRGLLQLEHDEKSGGYIIEKLSGDSR